MSEWDGNWEKGFVLLKAVSKHFVPRFSAKFGYGNFVLHIDIVEVESQYVYAGLEKTSDTSVSRNTVGVPLFYVCQTY